MAMWIRKDPYTLSDPLSFPSFVLRAIFFRFSFSPLCLHFLHFLAYLTWFRSLSFCLRHLSTLPGTKKNHDGAEETVKASQPNKRKDWSFFYFVLFFHYRQCPLQWRSREGKAVRRRVPPASRPILPRRRDPWKPTPTRKETRRKCSTCPSRLRQVTRDLDGPWRLTTTTTKMMVMTTAIEIVVAPSCHVKDRSARGETGGGGEE